MPTNRESRAAMGSVSVPMRTSCATTRRRSCSVRGTARTAPTRRVAISPSNWSISRMPAPSRPSTPGSRGRVPIASIAIVPIQVPGTEEVPVLARRESVEQVPVADALAGIGGPRVPACEGVERRPRAQDAAVLRHQAVEDGRGLAEPPAVLVDVAEEREERVQPLVPPAVVVERLPAPEEEERVTSRVESIVRLLALHAVGRPRPEAGRDAVAVAAAVERREAPRVVLVRADTLRAHDERPRRRGHLAVLAAVDGVHVRDGAPGTTRPGLAVDGRPDGEVHPAPLPAVARHQHLAPDVERPEHVVRTLAAGDLLAPVERPHARAVTVLAADGRVEREGHEAALHPRLGQLEVGGEHHRPHALPAGEVLQVEPEGEDRQAGAVLWLVAVEEEREQG